MEDKLEKAYQIITNTASDINELIPTLVKYAKQCKSIVEFGTRTGVSTIGFLYTRPLKFNAYDIVEYPEVNIIRRLAQMYNINFNFHKDSSLNANIEETDLIFFDTIHRYEHLKTEMKLHMNKVKKYAIFHDTTTFAHSGENGIGGGIWPAIEEYLNDNKQFIIKEKIEYNNGLTILERI